MSRLLTSAFDRMLRANLRHGHLRVVMPDGDTRDYGDPTGTPITVRLHDAATIRHLALDPEIALGEAYMNGTLTVDDGNLRGFLALVIRNVRAADAHPVLWQKLLQKARTALRAMTQNNIAGRARQNAAHHYDLSGEMYDLFLDADRQYSCGYFRDPAATLDQAQADKKAHIARKLRITPGMSVLDIGCGWGGMALTLARDHGARVTGITLSQAQQAHATCRAEREGLSYLVTFELRDYRHVSGTFDRIVSVGMFEHVGLQHFDDYFATVRNLLCPDGIALIHTIGWTAPAKSTNPWLAKYIFPGGYVPCMSEVMGAIERARLWATDIECWRLHYAYTLRRWYDRFNAHEDAIRALYDARFARMWRFYLAASEQTFRHGPQAVFQIQLSRSVDAVPLTRDYMYEHAPTVAPTQALVEQPPAYLTDSGQTAGTSQVISFREKSNDRQDSSGRRRF